jgi:hypothetical protein
MDLGLRSKSKSKSGSMFEQQIPIEAGIYKAKKILSIRACRTNRQHWPAKMIDPALHDGHLAVHK